MATFALKDLIRMASATKKRATFLVSEKLKELPLMANIRMSGINSLKTLVAKDYTLKIV